MAFTLVQIILQSKFISCTKDNNFKQFIRIKKRLEETSKILSIEINKTI